VKTAVLGWMCGAVSRMSRVVAHGVCCTLQAGLAHIAEIEQCFEADDGSRNFVARWFVRIGLGS
jgi:hypothetical protein